MSGGSVRFATKLAAAILSLLIIVV